MSTRPIISQDESAINVVLKCANCNKSEIRKFSCSAVLVNGSAHIRCQMYPNHPGLHTAIVSTDLELEEWASCECREKTCEVDFHRHQAPLTRVEAEQIINEHISKILCDKCASGIGIRHG